jgi:uncharacterized protein YbjT (DUF2867 family)
MTSEPGYTGLVLVAGATGGTGRLIVAELRRRGIPVRALVRDAGRAADLDAELAVGATTEPATLPAALAGVRAVICATGTHEPTGPNDPMAVDYRGVANLTAAARAAGVEQMVLISTIAATRPEHPLNRFGRVLDAKLAGENALRDSGVPFTVIRPGGLRDGPGGQPLRFAQGDTISGLIDRADVARVAVEALLRPAARGKTFEVIADPDGSRDFDALFAGLI